MGGAEKCLLQGQASLKNSKLPNGFWGKDFMGEIWGEGSRVYSFLLIGWWWVTEWCPRKWCPRNPVLILKLSSLTWLRALVPAKEIKGIVMYSLWGGIRLQVVLGELFLHYCFSTIVSWLLLPSFFILSLPWSAPDWICPLELRECHGGWMKSVSYKQQMGNTERMCTWEPQRIRLGFNPLFYLILLSVEDSRCWTRKSIMFWIVNVI